MNSGSSLVLKQIDVRRMPGIYAPFTVKELCGGINLIYGPNASGKTTTALTIQSILWPDSPVWRQGSFCGHFSLDGASWIVDFDAGPPRFQRDGVDVTSNPVIGPDNRDRYVLKLPDLLTADDPAFATAILLESAGGYDLQAAVTSLGYRDKVSRPGKELSELRKVAAAVRASRQEQTKLADQESKLSGLRHQLEMSRDFARRSAQLKLMLDMRKAEGTLHDAQEALKRYPAILERCSGDELQTLETLRSDHKAASERLTNAKRS